MSHYFHNDFRELAWVENILSVDDKEPNTSLVALATPGDGSCYYHAVAYCYYIPYRTGLVKKEGNLHFKERQHRIAEFRKKLANRLDHKDKINKNGKTYYENINNGALVEFASSLQSEMNEQIRVGGIKNKKEYEDCLKEICFYSLEGVRERLGNPREFFDFTFHGFISDWTDKDIYILDEDKQDIYLINEPEKFYKGRKSIIINYRDEGRHFESVGLYDKTTGEIDTYFTPDHELILALRRRIDVRIEENRRKNELAAAVANGNAASAARI